MPSMCQASKEVASLIVPWIFTVCLQNEASQIPVASVGLIDSETMTMGEGTDPFSWKDF